MEPEFPQPASARELDIRRLSCGKFTRLPALRITPVICSQGGDAIWRIVYTAMDESKFCDRRPPVTGGGEIIYGKPGRRNHGGHATAGIGEKRRHRRVRIALSGGSGEPARPPA